MTADVSMRPVLVRGFVEPPADANTQPAKRPAPSRRTVLLHVAADDHERFVGGVALEVLDGVVVDESVVVSDAVSDDDVRRLTGRLPERADTPPGLAADAKVLRLGQLGPYVVRRCHRHGWTLSGWDLPWILGRIASYTGRSAPDGFSLGVGGATNAEGRWRDSDFLPRIRIHSRGPSVPGAFITWGVPKDPASRLRQGRRPGPFLDLASLTGAVCGGEVGTAADGAGLLGVAWPSDGGPDADPIGVMRAQAAALVRLHHCALEALEAAAPGLAPERAWSSGSIAQHLLRAAGVDPLAAKAAGLPVEVKAAGAAGFHGGRVEAALVGVPCPIVVADLASTYPADLSLLNLSGFVGCERIEADDVTDELRRFLASTDLATRLYDRQVWARWGATVAVVEPRGEHLPAQVRWAAGRVGGTVAPVDLGGGRLPAMWCDLAAAAIDGAVPQVVRAWRLRPVGHQRGLRPLRLPSGRLVDLACDDLGAALVAERHAIRADPRLAESERRRLLSLSKLVANALCFGLWARHDRRSRRWPVDHTAYGPDATPLTVTTARPELPGPDAFLPLAAAVTSACRLTVAMATRAIRDIGGTVALVATDAIAVPASPDGGMVACPGGPQHLDDGTPALRLVAFDQLQAILGRFDRLLAPWGGHAWADVAGTLTVPAVGLVCGVNKLILGRHGDGRELVRSSDADMGGHLVDPSATGARLGDGRWAWAGHLELAVLAANAGRPLTAPLHTPTRLPPWADQPAVRPYRAGSWSQLTTLRAAVGDPTVGAFARFRRADRPAAGPTPTAVGSDGDWRVDGHPAGLFVVGEDGGPCFVGGTAGDRSLQVRSVRDHLGRWLREQDPSMAGPRRGLRHPVPVFSHPALVEVVGRAGEPLSAGDTDDETPPSIVYGRPHLDTLRADVKRAGRRAVARRAGITPRQARSFADGGRPRTDITTAVAEALSQPERVCQGCGRRLEGRARLWCSKRCQKTAERARRRTTRTQADPDVGWGCPGCGATNPDGSCPECGERWCPTCGAVLLGAATGVCRGCGTERDRS